jgi:hypothetical protein
MNIFPKISLNLSKNMGSKELAISYESGSLDPLFRVSDPDTENQKIQIHRIRNTYCVGTPLMKKKIMYGNFWLGVPV